MRKGTRFTTLDGVERELNEADLMICDAEKPMCIAGVFGGLDSGVTEGTKERIHRKRIFQSHTRASHSPPPWTVDRCLIPL